MPVIAAIFLVTVALGGRWTQLHPERIAPKGIFLGPNTFFARLFRLEVALVGTGMVFGGVFFALCALFYPLPLSPTILVIARLFAGAAAVTATIYVRKEVRKRPPYVSSSPYGWWP